MNPLKKMIAPILEKAVSKVLGNDQSHPVSLEKPREASWGDLSSTVALQLSKTLKRPPQSIAQDIVAATTANSLIDEISVAPNGFINIKVSSEAKMAVVQQILTEKEQYGRSCESKGRVIIEFVSANPTGPLHVGHGRQGVIGDTIANLLSAQGWSVHREFYYNDAGNQIKNLALSVQARIKGIEPDNSLWPKDGYLGEYIIDIARAYLEGASIDLNGITTVSPKDPENLEAITKFAVTFLRIEQNIDLDLFGINFDQFFLESSVYEDGTLTHSLEKLKKNGYTYTEDGALWLKTTDFGDDKDRVMQKSDGSYTYFVPDIAYHSKKWERGFKKAVNIQGTDHHSTTIRLKAGLQGLDIGIPQNWPEFVLHSMVKVFKDKKEVKISKRAGSYVTLRDLISWVGKDNVRFFFLMRKADSELLFDLDLAVKKNEENPVYYVQYAHARACSLLSQANNSDTTFIGEITDSVRQFQFLNQTVRLINQLADFPDVLKKAADELAPHLIPYYLKELAASFHGFYNAERILDGNPQQEEIKLRIVKATQIVISNGLALLNVKSPEKM